MGRLGSILGNEAGLEISGCDSNIYPPMSEHLAEMGIDITKMSKEEAMEKMGDMSKMFPGSSES